MNRFRGVSPQLTRESPRVGKYRRGPQLRTTAAGTWFFGLDPDDRPAGLLLVFPGVDLKILLPTISRLARLKVPGVLPASPKLEVQAGRQWMVTTAPPIPALSEVLDDGEHRTPGNAAALLADIAQTLHVVHQNDLVHGSVTAKSVVIGPDGSGLLTEWATSKTTSATEDVAAWTKLAHALAESWCTDLEAAAVLARAVSALTGTGWDAALEQLRPLAAEADRHSLSELSATHLASPGQAARRRRPAREPISPVSKRDRTGPTAIPPDIDGWQPPLGPSLSPEPEPAEPTEPVAPKPTVAAVPVTTNPTPPRPGNDPEPAAVGEAAPTETAPADAAAPAPAARAEAALAEPEPAPVESGVVSAPATAPPTAPAADRPTDAPPATESSQPLAASPPHSKAAEPSAPPITQPRIPTPTPTAAAPTGVAPTGPAPRASGAGPRGTHPAGFPPHSTTLPVPPPRAAKPREPDDTPAEGLRWPVVLAGLTIVALIGACTALLLPALRSHGLSLGLDEVTVQARKNGTVCTLVADINTNGGNGTIMYRWMGDIAVEPVMTATASGGTHLQLGRQWIPSDSPIGDPVVTLQILEPQPRRASAQPAAGCQ